MDNSTLSHPNALCQCLSLVPFNKISPVSFYLLDHGTKKLSTISLLRIFIAAQLKGWNSYPEIEESLRANKELCQFLGISSISGSQLSRRITQVPTELLQEVYSHVLRQLQALTKHHPGVSKRVGHLRIVDSTNLRVPPALHEWAYVSKRWNGVKMHTRLIVADPDTVYADRILPSTGNVSDYEGADQLVVESDATYVMDRGYASYKRMDRWIESKIHFVVRLYDKHQANIVKETTVPEGGGILRDAEVMMGSAFIQMRHPVRLIEFVDEQGRIYRVATTRRDLSAVEIAEIYRHRWLIELFFKWIKQHLKLVKLHSKDPQGIWNQMFLALIAYGISLYIKLMNETKQSQWQVLRLLQIYAEKTWQEFRKALFREPTRRSKGRQKVPEGQRRHDMKVSTVAVMKPVHSKGHK